MEDGEEGEEGNKIVRDDELVKVLDKLLFYLRIVHSVDFYSCSEYPHEDEMPNRYSSWLLFETKLNLITVRVRQT